MNGFSKWLENYGITTTQSIVQSLNKNGYSVDENDILVRSAIEGIQKNGTLGAINALIKHDMYPANAKKIMSDAEKIRDATWQESRKYFNEDENVKKTLEKLPKPYQKLLKGYKFLFEPKSTLYGDNDHVGMITNKPNKKVHISSPWRNSREFVLIHELGHLVFATFVKGTKLEEEWKNIVKRTKNKKKDESPEELFCHAFASYYSSNQVVIHNHDSWRKFIANLEKMVKS